MYLVFANQLTFSYIMLANDQPYFKNIVVLAPQDF